MSPILILALAASAQAFDESSSDAWTYNGEELQYLDENYEDGYDIQKVVGGKQVSNDRWDATVGIVSWGQVVCTGTLIHPKVVLTAAHCAGGIEGVLVNSDDYLTADNDMVTPVEAEVVMPDYYTSQWGGNDIAVLRLAERVTEVQPQHLAIECILDRYLTNKAKVEVVGYGATTESGNGWNTKLNHGTTEVQTKDCTATEVGGYWTGCDPNIGPGAEIGAGGDGVDACFGDSGGPLYLRTPEGDFLVGVTSRSYAGVPGNLPCKYGGIYTRPDYYIKWIEQNAGVKLDYHSCNQAPDPSAEGVVVSPGKDGETSITVSDPDGQGAPTFAIAEAPLHGTAVVDAHGVVTYTANEDAPVGTDSFVVAITDAGNPDYKRSGQPVTTELEIPVEIKGGCGCDGTGGEAGWFGLLGALAFVRRRR